MESVDRGATPALVDFWVSSHYSEVSALRKVSKSVVSSCGLYRSSSACARVRGRQNEDLKENDYTKAKSFFHSESRDFYRFGHLMVASASKNLRANFIL